MDLLNFMYKYTLSATAIPELLKMLRVADKFEVTSCVKYCSEQLLKLPISLEFAGEYLELPSSAMMNEAVQPLKDAANKYLAQLYKLQEEAMALLLFEVEILLASDEIQVNSEDEVFDFTLKWACRHYPSEEEYRKVLNNRLLPFIRFPYMSSVKLSDVVFNHIFDCELVS